MKEIMQEKLILKFKLPEITNYWNISAITSIGYRMTGNKFSVNFNGSKGYLSNVEIVCEGVQKERNNIIWVENLLTQKRTLKSKWVEVYHSEASGIRISI